ncbi:MAG: hypothetical protein KDC95_13885 [Planctomycetes bacterium]|nr:hypothetical protein [Planctomycetota bacterium]
MACSLVLFPCGIACTSHRIGIDPIEIKPIKVTVDVNVQVQRKLDDFFDFEDELEVRDESTESKSTEPGSSAENAKR